MIEQLALFLFGVNIALLIYDVRKTNKVHGCVKMVIRALLYKFPDMKDLLKDA